jgi:hypothetical protein
MPISRRIPAHDAMPAADPAVLKERARLAWQAARQRSVLAPAICDKLWSDTIMMHRSECLFALLTDRANWIVHEAARPPASAKPHPRPRAGRLPTWGRR